MKRKTFKITENTLFVYRQSGTRAQYGETGTTTGNPTDSTTDTTSIMTTTTHGTGVFNSDRNRR